MIEIVVNHFFDFFLEKYKKEESEMVYFLLFFLTIHGNIQRYHDESFL